MRKSARSIAPPLLPRRRDQPVDDVQWVALDALRANEYNPNNVAPPELVLLRLSLLMDGWTQPIVARRDGEIVDGYHRWRVAHDPEVGALTGGLVPVVFLRHGLTRAEQMAATVRHNRARGEHLVLRMAELVRALLEQEAVDRATVQNVLGMEPQEVERLASRAGMPIRGGAEAMGKGWTPA